MLSIRKILIWGIISLLLIWGVIFWLALTDKSYNLIIPTIPGFTGLGSGEVLSTEIVGDGPWKQDLFMGNGNLSGFDGKSFLVHGTATPSAIYKNNEVVVYFNYYPQNNRKAFGSINWIKSSDQGRKWTMPSPIKLNGLPELSTNPISPKAIVMPSGKIKLYFIAKKKDENRNKLFAALSNDGVNFDFDLTTFFEIEEESMISFSLTILNDRMHLVASTGEGAQTGTFYNAISYDTKVFTRLKDANISESFYGQNSLVTEGNQLKLLGASSKGLWISSSKDGNKWSSPSYLNINVQNPGTIFTGDKYLLFYTSQTTPDGSPNGEII